MMFEQLTICTRPPSNKLAHYQYVRRIISSVQRGSFEVFEISLCLDGNALVESSAMSCELITVKQFGFQSKRYLPSFSSRNHCLPGSFDSHFANVFLDIMKLPSVQSSQVDRTPLRIEELHKTPLAALDIGGAE